MARARTIKPSFWTSEQVMLLPVMARLLFIGMWNFADDNGVYPVSLIQLKAQIFPSDSFSLDDIKSWVSSLIEQKLIKEYSISDVKFWIITGWKKHQKIDKPTPYYPLPPDDNSQIVTTYPDA